MAGDDLFERVEQQVLSLGIGVDLGENEGEILCQVARTNATCECVCECEGEVCVCGGEGEVCEGGCVCMRGGGVCM